MTTKKPWKPAVPQKKDMSIANIPDVTATRERLKKMVLFQVSPKLKYETADRFFKKLDAWEKLSQEETNELWLTAWLSNITDHHLLLAEIPKQERDSTIILEFTDDLIREYDCKTVMERSLCEIIAASYYGIMRSTRQIHNLYLLEQPSNELNSYLAVLSKDMDRQNRTYLNAMMTLRAIKTPAVNFSIKANTAIFWQNQQFNDNRDKPWTKE